MKFRVAPKDFAIFVAFCIFLLYLCAIAVLNFTSFANDGSFYGLNPFPAFVGDNLVLTLVMFIIALIIIFSSVSSYIFDKDKSAKHLISFDEKEEKGYSRWAKDKEIKEDKGVSHVKPSDMHVEAAGIPLINNGTDIWVDNGEYHNLVIGSTGSGKSETLVKPMVNLLAKKGESMIITDPKGELYRYCGSYLKEQGYNIIILNFRDPQNGNAWNPLTLPYRYYKQGDVDKSTELLDDVASNILTDAKSKDPFWEKSAADYFSGLALGLFLDAKENEVNLNSINYMSTVGEERFATSNYIKEYFNLKGESSNPYIFASNTINAPTDTKGGITSTFRQKIRLFSSREKLSEMLSYSDFDMRSIGTQKTAIFMIIHDEKTTYHSLLTIFIKQCYETLIDVAKENGGKLPFRTNFILDEFANMPALKDVDSMVSAARSRDIRFTFIIQNFSQLNDVYGKEVAEVIKGNCGNLIYLISTEMAALEEISKMCGEVKSKDKDKTASTPLISVTDLQKMKLFEVIIKRIRMNPFRTRLEPDFKMDWGITRSIAEFPLRKEREIGLFDLKKYVSEEKRKRMMSDIENQSANGNNPSSFNPFMPGMPGMGNSSMNANPFGGNRQPNPFASMNTNPFGGNTPNPFASNSSNPFGGGLPGMGMNPGSLSNEDIDKMIADIDKKLKELDEEEAKQKAEAHASQLELPKTNTEIQPKTTPFGFMNQEPFMNEKKLAPQEPEFPKVKENVPVELDEKPKINIDADSIIMNDNIITDDEFFDDFFGDD